MFDCSPPCASDELCSYWFISVSGVGGFPSHNRQLSFSCRLLARVTSFLLHFSLPSSFPILYSSLKYSSALKTRKLKRGKKEKKKYRDMEGWNPMLGLYRIPSEGREKSIKSRRQRPERGASHKQKKGAYYIIARVCGWDLITILPHIYRRYVIT